MAFSQTPTRLVALGCVAFALVGCGSSDETDEAPFPVDAQMNLGESKTVSLEPFDGEHYSYSLEVPPQGTERYWARIELAAGVPGKAFRARYTTSCSWHAGEADEVSSTSHPEGQVTFAWSAQSSSQFVQIVSDEPEPFDLGIALTELPPQ